MPPDPISPDTRFLSAPDNRIATILVHIPWYGFSGQKRLADDVGVSRSTISRLIRRARPSVALALRVTTALSARLGKPLSVEDVFSPDGAWREPWGCRLCGCSGCFPDDAYDRRGNLNLAFRNMRPGDWSRGIARNKSSSTTGNH